MVGDWKLNPQKSKLIDEMKVTSLGGNKYFFDFGGGHRRPLLPMGPSSRRISGRRLP
jgi:hypothetical protein